MPPARLTLVRSNARTVDLSNRREDLKPYREPVIYRKDGSQKKRKDFSSDFMDIDEFFRSGTAEKEPNTTEEDYQNEDKDYPKPQVDLLASLLTLGKMIQDQKQLMEQQSKQNISKNDNDNNHETLVCVEPVVSSTLSTSFSDNDIDIENDTIPKSVALVNSEQLRTTSRTELLPTPVEHSLEETLSIVSSTQSFQDATLCSSSSEGMRRPLIPDSIKDVDYWDRRRRNNLAAKKSREERRKKELEVVEAADRLTKENVQLTDMLKRLTARNELLELRMLKIRRCQREGDSAGSTGVATTSDTSDTSDSTSGGSN